MKPLELKESIKGCTIITDNKKYFCKDQYFDLLDLQLWELKNFICYHVKQNSSIINKKDYKILSFGKTKLFLFGF